VTAAARGRPTGSSGATGPVGFAVVNCGELDSEQLTWLDTVVRGRTAVGVRPLALGAP
jgi:hypothetical protein